jgi:hypothetical protein
LIGLSCNDNAYNFPQVANPSMSLNVCMLFPSKYISSIDLWQNRPSNVDIWLNKADNFLRLVKELRPYKFDRLHF